MGSFMVIGAGRFGSSLAVELCTMGNDVLVIDENEDHISEIADRVTHAIIGDAKDEAVLRSTGVLNFESVIVAIGGDLEDSILITLILKEMGVKKIICKALNERHAKVLKAIGADQIIRPELDMGKRLAHALSQKNIVDFIELSNEYSIAEIEVPQQWIGRSLLENDLRKSHGITVIAVKNKKHQVIKVSPSADEVLMQNEILVVIGSNKNLERLGASLS